MNHFRKYYLIIIIGILFTSCVPMARLIFNIKNPRVYSSYTEVEPMLVSQIKKTHITDYTILYSYERWEDTHPLYFSNNGEPLPRTSCGLLDYNKIAIRYAASMYPDTAANLNCMISGLVTKDSLPFTKSLNTYDYIVVMPKTIYLSGVENFNIKDIKQSIKSSNVYYIFVNADYYTWQSREYKAGMKIKLDMKKDKNVSIPKNPTN